MFASYVTNIRLAHTFLHEPHAAAMRSQYRGTADRREDFLSRGFKDIPGSEVFPIGAIIRL